MIINYEIKIVYDRSNVLDRNAQKKSGYIVNVMVKNVRDTVCCRWINCAYFNKIYKHFNFCAIYNMTIRYLATQYSTYPKIQWSRNHVFNKKYLFFI